MTNPIKGILGLLGSTKGTLCLLTLGAMTYLATGNHIDGTAFAAGCGVLTTVFCWTQHRVAIAHLEHDNEQPRT